MKAIVCTKYGPPEVLQLREVEKPVAKDSEVLIKMRATSVTASDCIVRGFKLPRKSFRGFIMGLVLGFRKPRKSILGMIVSGEIENIGKNVKRFKKGDQVYGWTLGSAIRFGTYAEYRCLPENSVIVKKSEKLSFEEAAAIPYGGFIALHYLKKGDIQDREKTLIYGASGAIGTSAVQLAKCFGSVVTGVCSTKNLELVKSLGADTVIDYTKEDAATVSDTFNLILDAVGTWKDSEFKQKCKNLLAPDGKYISIDDGAPKAVISDLEFINKMVREGKLKPVMDKQYALEDIVEAHTYVDKGHKRGNVIVKI